MILLLFVTHFILNARNANALFIKNGLTMNFTDRDNLLEQKYTQMDAGLKYLVNNGMNVFLKRFLEHGEDLNLSSRCLENLLDVVAGIRGMEIRSINFLDASGKIQDGLLSGNNQMMGNYDQCLNSLYKSKSGRIKFSGQYCLLTFKPYLLETDSTATLNDLMEKARYATRNISELLQYYIVNSHYAPFQTSKFGLCITSGCSVKDVEEIARKVGNITQLEFTVQHCHVDTDLSKLDTRQRVIICIFSFFGIFGLIGTILDHCFGAKNLNSKSLATRLILCFSIKTNFSKLFGTDASDSFVKCLTGIRVLSIFHIMVGHQYIVDFLYYNITNPIPHMINKYPSFFSQIVTNAFLVVDVFFLLGGFLNGYHRMMRKDITSIPKEILHRLLRLYPTYIFSILIVQILTPRGPMSPLYEKSVIENCAQEWWKNLLFINNFFHPESVCLVHTWYLACDMQLFLISLITVPVFMKNPKRGIILNAAIVIGSLLGCTIWVVLMEAPPTMIISKLNEKVLRPALAGYVTPLSHVAPYFIGILLGYALSTDRNIKMSMIQQTAGWAVGSTLFIAALFLPTIWTVTDYTLLESTFYYTFSKTAYAFGVGWIVFCCYTGHGGIVNYILSIKIWIPLSRISFSLYLLSFPIQLFYRANLRTTTDTHPMTQIWEYFGHLCVSSLLAFAMVVLTESPILALEKLIFRRKETENSPQPKPANINCIVDGGIPKNNIECDMETLEQLKKNGINLRNLPVNVHNALSSTASRSTSLVTIA